MRQQEVAFAYKTCDYFAMASNEKTSGGDAQKTASSSSSSSSPPSRAPDAPCRDKMVEWCTQVTDYCDFSRETVAVALSYVDRYLSIIASASSANQQHRFTEEQRAPLRNRREYQLLCMTALHTAIKIREPLEMDTELVAELSRGAYSAGDVAWMEQQLLQVLGWRLAGPTSLDFCRHLIELIKTDDVTANDRVAEVMIDLCRYQTELASANFRFVTLQPSTVAVSSLLNSIEALGDATIVPAERLGLVEAIRRATNIDLSAGPIRACRDELMKGLAGFDVKGVAVDGNDSSCSGGNQCGRRESIGGSAVESPVSVVTHHGCCA